MGRNALGAVLIGLFEREDKYGVADHVQLRQHTGEGCRG